VDEDNWHCTIHGLRPNVCRNYPVSREQRDSFGCPGFWDDEEKSPGKDISKEDRKWLK